MAHDVDLIAGHVQPVVAPILEQEIVTLDPADGPGDHALVAGHAMLLVDDVVAGRQVVEVPAGHPSLRWAAAAATTGQIGLGQHRNADLAEHDPSFERRDDDVDTGSGQIGRAVGSGCDDAFVGQQIDQAGRRPLAVGGDHHPAAALDLGLQLGQ